MQHLRDQALAGRLTVEELDERCAQAYSARFVTELADLVGDLPAPGPARHTAPAPLPPVGPPGVRPFTYESHHPVDPEEAMEAAIRHVAPALHGQRYDLVERTGARLVFAYEYRPGWTYLVAVALPPFGLAALFHKAEERVVIELEPDRRRGGTRVIVSGNAPQRVRRAFAQLLEP